MWDVELSDAICRFWARQHQDPEQSQVQRGPNMCHGVNKLLSVFTLSGLRQSWSGVLAFDLNVLSDCN